jgi:hypothetical protein
MHVPDRIRRICLLALAGPVFFAACGDDSGTGPDPEPTPSGADTLAAPASALASGVLPTLRYEAREEDFSTDHPEVPGMPVSHNTLVLSLAVEATVGEVNSLLKELEVQIVGSIQGVPGESSGILFLRLPTETHSEMEQALARLRGSGAVRAAAQDAAVTTGALPSATGSATGWTWELPPGGGNWGMEMVGAPQLWNLRDGIDKALAGGTTSGTVVGILDAGFGSHPDVSIAVPAGTPNNWHGLGVAGVVGAGWGNAGVDGIDPYVFLVGRGSGLGSFGFSAAGLTSWAQAIATELMDVVAAAAATVVNVSLGFNWATAWSPPFNSATSTWAQTQASSTGGIIRDVLNTLAATGADLPVITASAGNDSGQPARYASPLANAALEHGAANIIVVEATDVTDSRASFSNTGGHLSAPGASVLLASTPHTHTSPGGATISHGNPYEMESGTSFASPMVAGLVSYLYTLSPGLPAPTLSDNPVLDLLVNTGQGLTGVPPRINAFSAAMDVDRVEGGDRVLRMLVDMDDGSPDGNLRLDPETGAVQTGMDMDGDGGLGDGAIDMSDFRVWRDAFLLVSQQAGLSLDGDPTHPKKDLNRNGTWDPLNDDLYFPRADLNGDGVVDPAAKQFVPGVIGGDATDLEVLGKLFGDPHYNVSELPGLRISADISINPASVMGLPETQSVQSYVYRLSDGALVQQRLHTGSRPGEEGYQIYTVPVSSGNDQFRLRLEAWDAGGSSGFVDTLTVTLAPGEDVYWDPECQVAPDGSLTGGTGEGTLCSEIRVDPFWHLIIPSGGATQFTATVTGLFDPSVTWSVEPAPVMGTIDQSGRYVSPSLLTGQAIANVIRATSVEDSRIFGRAVVHVSEPRVNPRDPSAGGCVPNAGSECSGEGSSWGDPHLVTPDDLKYDFMAVGDFVLTRSTAAGDGLEIHTRYGRPDGDKEFSWNKAVAMRVEGDVVELHAGTPGLIDIVVNGQDVTVPVDGAMELEGGGVISRAPLYITVSWPDRTQVEVAPSGVDGVLAYVRTSLPSSRYGQVEGLLGNFDGDPENDIRIRGGAVLSDPTPLELYTTYRESWWVPFGTAESLFSRGTEQFDPSFPPRAVNVFDLDTEDVIRASQVCLDAGVLDGEILDACVLDVVLTGDDRWAAVAAGMDPNALAIKISPSAAYVQQGDSRQFGAVLTGIADRRVQWATTGGTVQVDGDNIMTYTAPDQTGEYTLTATSIADGSLVASATVYVSEAATGFNKEWTGQVDGEWVNANNWMPAGEPDSTDNVYIPAGTPNPLYLRWSNKKVNNLVVEDGGSSGGAVPLVVRGNAVVEAPLGVIMTGSNKTVRGNVPLLRVQGAISPGGPLDVGRFYLDGGTFSPAGQTVNIRETLQSYAETGGRLVMNRSEDHVVVGGNVSFSRLSSALGSLTAGTLEVRGNLEMADGTVQFIPSGTHRVRMNGTEPQYIRVRWGYVRGNDEPPTNRVFNDLELANPAGVVVGDKAVQVNGAITVTAGSVSGVSVHLFGGLDDPAGGWAVPLVIRDPGVTLPAHLQANVTLAGGTFGVDYTPAADLTVTGAVEVRTGSTLRVGTRSVTVNGALTTVGDGKVVMESDDDRLTVNGDAVFGQGATVSAVAGALFSAGRFEITGDLTERINRYRASGTHVTAFTGGTAQTAAVSCHYSNCTPYNASAAVVFHGIEVSNPAGVTFQGRTMGVGGEVLVLAGGAAVFDQNVRLHRSLDVAGGLTLPAGRTLVVTESLILRSSGVLTNNGDLSAASCTKEEGHTINGTDPCG